MSTTSPLPVGTLGTYLMLFGIEEGNDLPLRCQQLKAEFE